MAEYHPYSDAILDDPRIVEPMRDLVGSERVAVFTDKLNLKRPREGSGFRWHQDSPYWTHACSHVDLLPNVMLTLDDAHEGNGCFRVVRGSHRRGLDRRSSMSTRWRIASSNCRAGRRRWSLSRTGRSLHSTPQSLRRPGQWP